MAVRLSALDAGRPLPPGRFLVLISVRSWVDRRVIVRLKGLGQLKNPMTSSGIEPATHFAYNSHELHQLSYNWLTKQNILACITVARNDREMGGYTMVIAGQRLGKHVPATTDTNATVEEQCYQCGPRRKFISNGEACSCWLLFYCTSLVRLLTVTNLLLLLLRLFHTNGVSRSSAQDQIQVQCLALTLRTRLFPSYVSI
jgi:hypothetical protein